MLNDVILVPSSELLDWELMVVAPNWSPDMLPIDFQHGVPFRVGGSCKARRDALLPGNDWLMCIGRVSAGGVIRTGRLSVRLGYDLERTPNSRCRGIDLIDELEPEEAENTARHMQSDATKSQHVWGC
jgi:hypothetical protein